VIPIVKTITSFPTTAKAIGRKAWRILHTAGMYYFYLIFAIAKRCLEQVEFGRRSMQEWGYLVLTLLVAIALIIRLLDRRKLTPVAAN
jgi:hypothetical protein